MLVMGGGGTLGTIGGGAVEYRAARLAAELLAKRESRFESYRLTPGDMADTGMICGGNVRVYFQYFDGENADVPGALADVLTLLDSPKASWLVTAMEETGWRMGTYDKERGLRGWSPFSAAGACWTRARPPSLPSPSPGRGRCTSSAEATWPGSWPIFWL